MSHLVVSVPGSTHSLPMILLGGFIVGLVAVRDL